MVKRAGNAVFLSACLVRSYNLHPDAAFSKSLYTPLNLCIMKDNISQSCKDVFWDIHFWKMAPVVFAALSTCSRAQKGSPDLGPEHTSVGPACHLLATLKFCKNWGYNGIKLNYTGSLGFGDGVIKPLGKFLNYFTSPPSQKTRPEI